MSIALFETVLSAISRYEYPIVAATFTLFMLFLFLFLKNTIRWKHITKRDIAFLLAFAFVSILFFSSYSHQYQPVYGEDAQAWTYLEHVRIMRDTGIPFSQKLGMLPLVHPSHPFGYSFLLFLFSMIVGFGTNLSLFSLIIFISSGLLLYALLRKTAKSHLLPMLITPVILFNPLNLYLMLYLSTEFFSLFLVILLAYVFYALKKNQLKQETGFYQAFFLLLILALAYTKFEYGFFVILMPFAFTPKKAIKDRLLLIMLGIFAFLFIPAVYHALFFNVNNPMSIHFLKEEIMLYLLPNIPYLILISPLAALSIYLAAAKKKYWALLPLAFITYYSSYMNVGLRSPRYLFSSYIFFLVPLLYTAFSTGISKKQKKSIRTLLSTKTALILIIIVTHLTFIPLHGPELISHSQELGQLSEEFFNTAFNCTYLEQVSPPEHTAYGFYRFWFCHEITAITPHLYSGTVCTRHKLSCLDSLKGLEAQPKLTAVLISPAMHRLALQEEAESFNYTIEVIMDAFPVFIAKAEKALTPQAPPQP